MRRLALAAAVVLGLLALGGGEADAAVGARDRRLPLCTAALIRDWVPADGQVCLAEDDPGWLARQPGRGAGLAAGRR